MPYKVKEHFRKTKKGELRRVRESTRKNKVKKALTIGAGALVTLGLGALAYKKLGSKLVKGAVSISNKADDLATNKAKDITALVTPKKLTQGNVVSTLGDKKYKTIPDPWLTSTSKPKKLTTKTTNSKEKILLLKKGNYDAPDYISPTTSKNVTGRGKDLGGEIRSQRTLIKREPSDIKEANKKLELANRYEASDSPALQRTGASYRKRATERLTTIAKRSPSKKQTGLVTTRGNASQGTNRSSNYQKKVREKKTEQLTVTKAEVKSEPPLSKVTKIPNKSNTKTRRDLLTGGKSSQELAENFIDSTIKGGINKAGDTVSDTIIPGSSQVGKTIRDIKGRAKQIERLSNELAESGDKVNSRRGFLKKTVNKLAEEGSLKPTDVEKVSKGSVRRSKETAELIIKSGQRTTEPEFYVNKNWHPFQVWRKMPKKRVYRQSQGAAESLSQIVRKFIRWKSGNHTRGRQW